MPHIVEVDVARDARGLTRLDPVVPEVAAPQLSALGAEEDVAVAAGTRVALQVLDDVGQDLVRESDGRTPAADFGALSKSLPFCISA
ncbi:hypothetical protein ACIOFQ_29565 [[Kitasatospora] papulosa]|uniref:hypothetical protein n=1 Tax=[Kitasatospora] papulosa TaxID=1464011 RepID=UPI0037F61632